MPIAFLLALQAAGMVMDYMATKDQLRMAKMGGKIEQAGIESEIQTTRLQTEEDSLQAMIQLRQNLGSQAALFAARGVQGGQGTAFLFSNQSVGNFNADERMRRTNQLGNEARLKAGMTLSKLHQTTYAANTTSEFNKRSLNRFPSTQEGWGKITEGFSEENGYGFRAPGKSGASFGLTKVGA